MCWHTATGKVWIVARWWTTFKSADEISRNTMLLRIRNFVGTLNHFIASSIAAWGHWLQGTWDILYWSNACRGPAFIMITIIMKSVDNLSLVYCRNLRLEPSLNQLMPMMQLFTSSTPGFTRLSHCSGDGDTWGDVLASWHVTWRDTWHAAHT